MDEQGGPEPDPETTAGGLAAAPVRPLMLRELSPQQRRRALARALGAVALLDGAMLALYSVLPATGWHVNPLVEFLVVLAFFLGVLTTQVRAIGRAQLPVVRAAATLALVIPLFFILCSLLYLVMEAGNADSFTQPIDRVSAMYFTITVFATVGFGDIAAKTDTARIAVSIQMVLDLILLGAVVQMILSVAKDSLSRTTREEPS